MRRGNVKEKRLRLSNRLCSFRLRPAFGVTSRSSMVGRFARLRQKYTRNSDQSESNVRKTSDTTSDTINGFETNKIFNEQESKHLKLALIIRRIMNFQRLLFKFDQNEFVFLYIYDI